MQKRGIESVRQELEQKLTDEQRSERQTRMQAEVLDRELVQNTNRQAIIGEVKVLSLSPSQILEDLQMFEALNETAERYAITLYAQIAVTNKSMERTERAEQRAEQQQQQQQQQQHQQQLFNNSNSGAEYHESPRGGDRARYKQQKQRHVQPEKEKEAIALRKVSV